MGERRGDVQKSLVPIPVARRLRHSAARQKPEGMTAAKRRSQESRHVANAGRLHISREAGQVRLRATGDWTLPHYTELARMISGLQLEGKPRVDLEELGALDTAGATLLAGVLGAERVQALAESAPGLSVERRALLQAVGGAMHREPGGRRAGTNIVIEMLGRMGRVLEDVWKQILMLLGFVGLTLTTFRRCLFRPRTWRVTALVSQMEETGLNAVPIVVLLTFAVGAVIAYLGATVLSEFGAAIYTIDLVAYSFLREFGVLITAIVLAGRTASAFAAHIGSMKANEELDALRAQGLDPVELLVLPRVMALILVLPMLTFLAMLSGLAGGGVVAVAVLDIPVARFFMVLGEVPLQHYIVGLCKAPVFAFLIAVIGCLEGFKAGGSAQSVGTHTTSSVVQSIFVVILLDAVAAMFFTELGW